MAQPSNNIPGSQQGSPGFFGQVTKIFAGNESPEPPISDDVGTLTLTQLAEITGSQQQVSPQQPQPQSSSQYPQPRSQPPPQSQPGSQQYPQQPGSQPQQPQQPGSQQLQQPISFSGADAATVASQKFAGSSQNPPLYQEILDKLNACESRQLGPSGPSGPSGSSTPVTGTGPTGPTTRPTGPGKVNSTSKAKQIKLLKQKGGADLYEYKYLKYKEKYEKLLSQN